MSIDVARARAETPGCEHVIHFNNSGASLMPAPVIRAVCDHLDREARIGGYEAEREAAAAIEHTYDALAALLNCSRDEIAVVENATVAWCGAFYGLPLGAGDRILTARAEYASNYIAYLHLAKRRGVEIAVVPDDEYGQVDVGALEAMIDERVKLISITHVPTNGGLVNPAAAVGRVARAAGVPFLLDACQSVGQMPLDVEALGCDLLSGTGRKFLRGPRGTGFLYVRRAFLENLDPPMPDLHAAEWTAADTFTLRPDARRFENWENYVAGKIGLGVAVDYALSWGLEDIRERVAGLAETFRGGLATLPGVTVRDLGRERCGIVSFTVAGADHEQIVGRLAQRRINCSVSPQRYTRLDMEPRGLTELIRAPVHYYNTEQEIDIFLDALRACIGGAPAP